MNPLIILDTGPLVAFIDKSDQYHQWALDIWPNLSFPLLTCEAVISEACFLLQTTHGGSDAVMGMVEDRIIQIDLQLSAEIASIRAGLCRWMFSQTQRIKIHKSCFDHRY